MDVRPATQAILGRVEEVTGFPVEILHDPSLPYLARVTRATPATPVHLLRINPTRGAPDYLIAYEIDESATRIIFVRNTSPSR